MKRRFVFAAISVALFWSNAQAQMISIPLRIEQSSIYYDTLWFGLDPTATYCIDPHLGEFELPPQPPQGVFDIRWKSNRSGQGGACFGEGLRRDYRFLDSSAQLDTFLVSFSRSSDAPSLVTLTWPREHIQAHFWGQVYLRDMFGGILVNVDMKQDSTLALTNPALVRLYIVAGITSVAAPLVLSEPAAFVTQTSAMFRSLVNPNLIQTNVWFEWGTSSAYGNTTASVVINGFGDHPVDLTVHDLSPQTTYHYRAVAENAGGTSYGNDVTFITIGGGVVGETIIPLRVANADDSTTLWIGLHPSASYCVDPFLGEYFLGPVPTIDVFDARLLDPRSPISNCFDVGIPVDLRPLVDSAQVDTFQLRIKKGINIDPVILSWPDLSGFHAESVRLIDHSGGSQLDVDMKTTSSAEIPTELLNSLFIISGPATPIYTVVVTDSAMFITDSTAQLRGQANPNGLATTVWFAWGTSPVLHSTTALQNIGAGTTVVSVASTLLHLNPGTTYYYRIVAQNNLGITQGQTRYFTTSGTTDILNEPTLPTETRLHQNYPNPFNPSTTLTFDIGYSSFVILKVYDILGQEVRTLVNERREPGTHRVVFNAEGLPSGVYICRIQAGGFMASRKMILTK